MTIQISRVEPTSGCESHANPSVGLRRFRVLSLSSVFPNPVQPGHGLFVESRLRQVASLAELKVLAPITVWNDVRLRVNGKSVPARRQERAFEVIHPRWLQLPGGGVLNPFLLALGLLRPLIHVQRLFAFELIDAHFGYPEGIAACILAALFGCPFVVTLRGSELLHGHKRLRRQLMGWALRRAGRVLTVSEELRRFAIALGVDPARVLTVPNGIDCRLFFPHDRAQSRAKHGIPANRAMLLAAGRLVELKGFDRMIRAISSLKRDGVRPLLLIVGASDPAEPGHGERLRQQADRLGVSEAVRFLGAVPPTDLAELMSAADVFCLASAREGWPNVVHEALACGTPVVATSVGGIPSLIPSEAYGLIVPVSDQSALDSAVKRALLMRWDRRRIAAWGGRRSWEHVAAEVLEQLQALVQTCAMSARDEDGSVNHVGGNR